MNILMIIIYLLIPFSSFKYIENNDFDVKTKEILYMASVAGWIILNNILIETMVNHYILACMISANMLMWYIAIWKSYEINK